MRRFSNYCEVFNHFHTKLCQTKPNLKMPKMNVTPVSATTTNNEQPTMNRLKQTQTKPILPAVAGKIALSVVEGPVKNVYRPPCQSGTQPAV
jgi:hypothetical protein